jgi:hypothetical protein
MLDYDALFVKNEDGSLVFYPWTSGRGYVVHSKVQRDQIVRELEPVNQYLFFYLIGIFLSTLLCLFFDFSTFTNSLLFVCAIAAMYIFVGFYYKRVLDGLPRLEKPLGTLDSLRLQVLFFTYRANIAFFIFFLITGIIFKETILLIFAALFFVEALYKYYQKSLA